ncbi:MAG TPA: right-handed parallel beta-helix repeat-containing protein [Sandaracinaceae bacterium LLY-WYZ-13_1]|nr:right-handed parallel beta-helix repeat-containing protein [Sandaracinaceae bacterium LLY-WYZ-13_1]
MARHATAALTSLLLLVVGCDEEREPPDAEVADRDAGGRADAGHEADAGSDVDAGPDTDGGPGTDAGPSPACSVPPPFDEGVTYERTLHVAPDGDDANDGSAGAPLATIREAGSRATPGTRVRVAGGTYGRVSLDPLAGEPGRPIAFVADGAVTIDASDGTGWRMTDSSYVVLEGFTIENAQVHGMNLDDGGSFDTPMHHLVLRGLTVRDAGSGGNNDCIKMSGVDDFWILDSDVSGCDRGEIVDMVGCHRGVIHGNVFHDTVQNGVQAKGGSADTLIHGNVFRDIPGRGVNAGGSTGLAFFRPTDAPHEAARIRIVANVFERVGAESGAPVAYVGCDACAFVHNTVIEPRTWVARILQESTDARFVPSRNGVFASNLVVVSVDDLSTWVNVGPDTAPETFTFSHDLWYALDRGPSWGGPSLPSAIPAETDAVVQEEPRLVDRAGGDYRLQTGSPAIGAGRDVDGLEPDFDGRCYASPPAIGAFAAP